MRITNVEVQNLTINSSIIYLQAYPMPLPKQLGGSFVDKTLILFNNCQVLKGSRMWGGRKIILPNCSQIKVEIKILKTYIQLQKKHQELHYACIYMTRIR